MLYSREDLFLRGLETDHKEKQIGTRMVVSCRQPGSCRVLGDVSDRNFELLDDLDVSCIT